jgi:hypothetical protein
VDEKTRTFEANMVIPPDPPSRAEFNAWVTQSINQAAEKVYNTAMAEHTIAAILGASHVTTSHLIFDLLRDVYHVGHRPTTSALNTFVQMQLPFLEGVDPARLMEIRLNEAEAFDKFRATLERRLKDFEHVQDSSGARRKAWKSRESWGRTKLERSRMSLPYCIGRPCRTRSYKLHLLPAHS